LKQDNSLLIYSIRLAATIFLREREKSQSYQQRNTEPSWLRMKIRESRGQDRLSTVVTSALPSANCANATALSEFKVLIDSKRTKEADLQCFLTTYLSFSLRSTSGIVKFDLTSVLFDPRGSGSPQISWCAWKTRTFGTSLN